MKIFILIVSKTFPKTHKRAGESTGFVDNISKLFTPANTKIHTIRANIDLWSKRAKEINDGRAFLSIRYWSGKPYNSEQVEICKLRHIGIQKFNVLEYEDNEGIERACYCVDDMAKQTLLTSTLAKNDGLSLEDFREWFKDYDLSNSMAIIHFTEFRY